MFVEKLNKKQQGVYVIEEQKIIIDGIWEGTLDHDNVNVTSISIYSGSKLTGERVNNYFISTPSETPWKTSLKIFSDKDKVYVTYETSGDQIEADDINRVQEVLADTKDELSNYKESNDLAVDNLKSRTTSLENNKAEKVYVDTELLKKADKINTYTKQEVLAEIERVIDAAPDALNTLKEIASALNNDPDFASTITNELSKKVDKVAGKSLSDENYTLVEKQKLAGIEQGANKYIHPGTHPATMIVEDEAHRFVEDSDISNWNGKLNATANAVSASKLAAGRKISLSGDVTGSTVFDGSNDVTITATVNDDSHYHIIDNIDGLQDALNSKETPAGAQLKVNDHANKNNNPHAVTKAQIGLGNVTNESKDIMFSSPTLTGTPTAPTATTGTNTTQIATTAFVQSALSTSGYGNMLKSVYDTAGRNTDIFSYADTKVATLEASTLSKTGDSKDNTVTFTEVATEASIVSGEKHSTLFGKILKSINNFRTRISNAENGVTTLNTSFAAHKTSGDHDARYNTKSEITNLLAIKAPLASPVFTGNPTAPTQATATNNTRIATTAFVQANKPLEVAAATTSSFVTNVRVKRFGPVYNITVKGEVIANITAWQITTLFVLPASIQWVGVAFSGNTVAVYGDDVPVPMWWNITQNGSFTVEIPRNIQLSNNFRLDISFII